MNLSFPNLAAFQPYTDARTHGYQGPSRYVRLPRVAPNGLAAIARNEDGTRCVVAGKESLRIVRSSGPGQSPTSEHKTAVGPGGHRLEASRNFWDSSGLKVDSASTDVAWGYGLFNNKILTSARSGELIMWDINKSGGTKYERRSKDHIRSINRLSVSRVVHYYCITGSADGDMRIWDLRDLSKSVIRVRHSTSIRSIVFSPCVWLPLQAIVGLDNGSIQRWDLKMGQRGNLDRLNVAHSAPVTALDWCSSTASSNSNNAPVIGPVDPTGNGLGWLVSGGLDKTVKVWDLTAPNGANNHIPSKPTYVLHPSYPVRRVIWRPGYDCEVAVVSNDDLMISNVDGPTSSSSTPTPGLLSRVQSGFGLDTMLKGFNPDALPPLMEKKANVHVPEALKGRNGETVEIWDIRREWIPKWTPTRASSDGNIVDIAFEDSHAVLAQYASGTFARLDLREVSRPIVSVNRVATTWDVAGSLTFVANKPSRWDPPYDDVPPQERSTERKGQGHKQLGDPPIRLKTQALSTFIQEDASEDLEIFIFLAKNYRFYGPDKEQLCGTNAEIALQAGDERASQIWRLLGATLTDHVPISPPATKSPHSRLTSLPPGHTQAGYHFPATPNNYSFLGNTADNTSHKWSPGAQATNTNASQLAVRSRSPSSRRLTPSSSKSNSPMVMPAGLPITPNRTNIFNRRQSVDSGTTYRQSSAFRRPSLAPVQYSNGASPNERTPSISRHVGEGALDDSSSSSDGREETPGLPDSDDEHSRAVVSPALNLAKHFVTPSPLSRVVKQQSSEEENEPADEIEDEASSSASPRSTDTESDGSSMSRRQAKSRSNRRAFRIKTRSRSSTIASLAAPPPRLAHQESYSSIRTVTAGETRSGEKPTDLPIQMTPETPTGNGPHHRRHRSQPIPEFIQEISSESEGEVLYATHVNQDNVTLRSIEVIRAEERRIREIAWSTLRKVFDDFLDEGDVQIGAMMCLLAHEEMRLSQAKVVRVVTAYLDRLMRLRLYTSAAFIRKYSNVEALQKKSLMETVIYSSCAGCGKPIARPAAQPLSTSRPFKGAFAYCLACKKPTVRCSICHLPVRSLLFQCSVCQHGGHQSCYRRYYMEHPMVELPTSFLPSSEDRGRSLMRMVQEERSSKEDNSDATSITSTRSESSVLGTSAPSPTRTESSSVTTRLMGHSCAAGCGHFCWAANMLLDGKDHTAA